MTAPPLLELRNLTVGYRAPVVADLSLSFGRGQFVALLGANGSGKTTLLRTISRHIKPLSGEALINGQNVNDIKPSALAKILSVVLTDRSSVPMLRALEFVALGRHPHSDFLGRLKDRDLHMVESALEAVRATDLADRFVDELSDGERQKIVLARALAQEPTLMLLDEPTAHLDLKHRLEILAILRGLCHSRELSVLAAVHDVESASKIADLALTIKKGKLAGFGQPEAILTPSAVRELYDCPQANFDSALGGLEIATDGQAGRAFVLAGTDKGALIFRLLAKHGYALSAGFFRPSDLDAHVALALGAKILTLESLNNETSANSDRLKQLFDEALLELDRCDLLAVAKGISSGEPNFPVAADLSERLVLEAQKRNLPIIKLGEANDLSPLIEFLGRLKAERSSQAA
ncbi:MAG: ABC transporter ATP-binding protein [Deltaproteobacteria bacterium]|jgi:iron complex transport system ATP-binding protein|nr:ABC transporter ATP-binding protein [Deltaproteobacteria bacterium]